MMMGDYFHSVMRLAILGTGFGGFKPRQRFALHLSEDGPSPVFPMEQPPELDWRLPPLVEEKPVRPQEFLAEINMWTHSGPRDWGYVKPQCIVSPSGWFNVDSQTIVQKVG